MAHKVYKINGGPSKFDLMLGLFQDKPLEFSLEGSPYMWHVRITTLTRIDDDHGKYNHWEIIGYFRSMGSSRHEDYRKCQIDFSAYDRKGTLTVIDERPEE